MRAQKQKIKLIEEGGASEDDILAAKARYKGTSHEYAEFSKAMDLPQQRQRVYTGTVDKNSGSGKIRSSKNDAKISGKHYFEKLDITVDIADEKAIEKTLKEFEEKYKDSDIEHCRVITATGEVYEVHGDRITVDTSLLDDKMKSSINEHNHVTG